MSLPQYKPSPFEARLKKICDERNGSEMLRVFSIVETEYPKLKEVFPDFHESGTARSEPSLFKKVVRSMMTRLSGNSNFYNKRSNPWQIREHFIQIFSCPYVFRRKCWNLNYPLSPDKSENENIIEKDSVQYFVGDSELINVRDLIADYLKMIGMLAIQINSCELQRILRLIVATKNKPWSGDQVTKERAAELADEIFYCFEAIMTEIDLLPAEKRIEITYPKFPRHRPDLIIDVAPPDDLTPVEKTKWSRDRAYRAFKETNYALFPFLDFNCEEFDVVLNTKKEVDSLADEFKTEKITLDKGWDKFDYRGLGDVLSAELHLYYDYYFTDSGVDESRNEKCFFGNHEETREDTEQQKAKDHIIQTLRGIINDAIRLSAESAEYSQTLTDYWLKVQIIFERRAGDFHSFSPDDDDAAEADLRAFIKLFREGRQKLWAARVCLNRTDIKRTPMATIPQGPVINALNRRVGDVARILDSGTNHDKIERRTEAQRRQIDEVALPYIRSVRITLKQFNLSGACQAVIRRWKNRKMKGGYPTAEKLREVTRYDLKHHYNYDAEVAKMKLEEANGAKISDSGI